MDVLEEVRNVISSLNKIENHGIKASEELSNTELAINDLYHFIEFNSLNTKARYRIFNELKSKLAYRRQLKNELALINEFNSQKNKLLVKENRNFIINNLKQKLKTISGKYKYRVYTEEELKELIGV